MPSKRIIILEKLPEGNRYNYALWVDVPAARQSFFAKADKKSAWTEASTTENADIAAGRVYEKTDLISVAEGRPLSEIQQELQQVWQRLQDEINTVNKYVRYGTFWDGATWTLAGRT